MLAIKYKVKIICSPKYHCELHCDFFLTSTFQKIDFKNVAAFSIFHYLLVQFRKCLIFEFIEIRFDFRKNSFSERCKINPDYE